MPGSTPTQSSWQKSNLWMILFIVFFIIALYLSIKFAINFKRSIKKTKTILNNHLVIPYVQGFTPKSSAFFNFLMINGFCLILLIILPIQFAKTFKQEGFGNSSITYLSILITIAILLISFDLSILIMFLLSFKEKQYVKNNQLLATLNNLKTTNLTTKEFPNEIKLDVKKMDEINNLGTKVIAKFMLDYNKMSDFSLNKRYKSIYLDQLFKISYFHESLNFIEKQKSEESKLLSQSNVTSDNDIDKLNKVETEIAWMDKADNKAKILKETENISNSFSSKKEFDSKYEEYLYTIRSQDPMYASVQRNSWVTYRDSDIENLFYNPNFSVIYSLDNGKSTQEKPLQEFLDEYKNYLINKFYSLI
ncbi:hypothetical protein [Metamycoplasma buccale]|uniref:hypothetical protein n=1 Tax=Metamycoplasma buccale TaxID=55602 RepID=UPI00398F400B